MKIWRAQCAKSAKQQGLESVGVGFGGFAPKTHGAWNFADSHLWHDSKMGDTHVVKGAMHLRKVVTVPQLDGSW